MSQNFALRIALVFNGTVVREDHFTQTSEPVVTVGEHARARFSIPAPGLPESLDMFRRTEQGYLLRVTDSVDGVLEIDGEEHGLMEFVGRTPQVGSTVTAAGRAGIHEVEIVPGDWGLVELGEVEVFFQLLEHNEVVAGRGVRDRLDGSAMGAVGLSMFMHATFLMVAFLLFQVDPTLEQLPDSGQFATFMVDDAPDPLDEEETDEPSEETSGEKVKGEEGKIGEPDSEIVETVTPKNEGEMVDEIDPTKIGINEALTTTALGAGPLKNIFDNNDGFDDTFDVAMSGNSSGELELGRGQGGVGLRGDGNGGGGESFGRIGAIGSFDTGGGKNPGAKLGPKTERKVPAQVTPGTPQLGDFCDKGDIRRVVNAKQNAVKYCFEKELQTNPELSGKVIAQWQVGLDGAVMSSSIASSSLGDQKVEACIARVIKRLRFQKPDGGICVINYPFVFVGLDGATP